MAKKPVKRSARGGGKGGGASTLKLMVLAAVVLLAGLGLGQLLGNMGCKPRKAKAPEHHAPEPPKAKPRRPEPEPETKPEPAPEPEQAPEKAEPEKPEPKAPEAKAPEKAKPHAEAQPQSRLPKLAFIIDDLGYMSPELVTRLCALKVKFSVAVLPYQEHSKESADIAFGRGKEVMLHLPMEGIATKDPGPDALLANLDEKELRARTRKALWAVPHIVGANNHMGSKLTSDRQRVTWVLQEFKGRHLYFIDSRTSAQTQAEAVARELGIPTASRQVFLDDDKAFAEIEKQWERALKIAEKDGQAIAIGHIYPETVEALEKLVPKAKDRVQFVKASELVK